MRLLIAVLLFLLVCGFGAVTFLAFGLTWGTEYAGVTVIATLTLASGIGLADWCASE